MHATDKDVHPSENVHIHDTNAELESGGKYYSEEPARKETAASTSTSQAEFICEEGYFYDTILEACIIRTKIYDIGIDKKRPGKRIGSVTATF